MHARVGGTLAALSRAHAMMDAKISVGDPGTVPLLVKRGPGIASAGAIKLAVLGRLEHANF